MYISLPPCGCKWCENFFHNIFLIRQDTKVLNFKFGFFFKCLQPAGFICFFSVAKYYLCLFSFISFFTHIKKYLVVSFPHINILASKLSHLFFHMVTRSWKRHVFTSISSFCIQVFSKNEPVFLTVLYTLVGVSFFSFSFVFFIHQPLCCVCEEGFAWSN